MKMTAADLHRWLTAFPYPGATNLHLDELGCGFTVGGAVLRYDFDGWIVNGTDFDHNLPPPDEVSADRVHAEIARVLALVKATADPPKPVRLARMEPGHLYGVLLADPFPGAVDLRLDKTGLHFTVGGVAVRFDGEAFYAPRYHVRSTLPHPSATNAQGVHAEIHRVLAIVMGAGEPDAPQDRRKDVEAELAKMTDAHAVVSQRLVGAQREVAERDATIDELRARVKGSCATKDEPGDLDPLLSRHNAPVKIGDRTLSPAERAAFVIRRLTRAAQNARAEAAALRAEQEEIAEALGDAPTYAEHADGSLVGLNLVERIRARLT